MHQLVRWLGLMAIAWAGLMPAARGAGAPDYRFKLPAGLPPVTLSSSVLSDADRAYIAGLPEIRVALQRVGAPPFERVAADGEISGLQPEMLSTLARVFGLRIRPVVLETWPDVLKAVQDGNADMVLTLASTPDRQRYLAFTLGTVNVPSAVFARSGGPAVALDHARFAMERGYSSVDYVARRYPAATVIPVQGTVQALRLVAEGSADVYVGSLLEALDMLLREPVPGIEVQQILSDRQGFYHFGVRKDWARLVAILNRGIASWRSSPEARTVAAALPASVLPPGLRLPMPVVLSASEATLLAEHALWRVGAVRGLSLLNDVDALGQHAGIAADYVEQVTRRLGVGTELVPFDNVAAMLDALRAGRIDVVPFLTRTEERAREFSFSQPYFTMPYVLVARSDAPLYWDLASLRGKRLALAAQHPLRDVLKRRYADIMVVDASDGNAALDMVAAGEADAAVEVKLFANLRINSDGAGRLRALGSIDELPAEFRFATAAAAAPLLPLIDRALADVPVAERERLLRRWVAVDLVPPFPWRRWAPTLAVALAALLLLAGGTAWWTRRLAREVQQRRRADEQLEDIGRTMPGVAFRYVLGPGGTLLHTFFSAGATAFFGFAPPRGQTVVDFIGPRLRPEHRAAVQAAQVQSLHSGERFRHTVAYMHPDGQERWLYAEAVRSLTRDGHPAWTGYVIDVSSEHALQERLAQEARERHLMLASASHELRAPAHQLALALQDAALDGVAGEGARPLAIARDAARSIGQLLDDVLDAARLDAGRLELRPQEFDLHALLAQIADSQRGVMADKGLRLELHIAAEVPRTVHADPLRLKQVLVNLLSNAAKYTPAGGVTLQALMEGGLLLQVRDTGVGIAPAQQQWLFEPFTTLHNEAQVQRSSGLGLSICRRLVGLMGGRITLASEPGVGTEVSVHLPLPPLAGRPVRRDGVLLLCDDDEVSRLLLSAALARLGHTVVEAARGDEALLRWQQGDVRLLITDLGMPGLDGMALVRAIRAAEAAEPARWAAGRTGILICSGSEPPALQADEPGDADAFLSKPVDLHALADTLQALTAAPPARA